MILLDPQSVAVIGASETEGKVGHDILKNLLTQGYKGEVYPVNPKSREILGAKTYPSIMDVPETVDLAVIVIPAKFVPEALEQCGMKGVKNVVVISAGFSEVHTDEGKKLEDDVIAIAKKFAINLVGPNCLGILRPKIGMNASFGKDLPPTGHIAFISQSGATAVGLMDAAPHAGLAFSAILSIGNKATMDECDFLELCAEDPETKVIGFYLESIRDGRRFLHIASKVAREKPIVLLKSGVSEHGKKAASSHTGALAGSDAGIAALCKQAGIHRAHSTEEFFDLLEVLSTEPPLLSEKIAIITNAGGPGILATDATEAEGLRLPALSEAIEKELRTHLPAAAATGNPIDVIGDADADRYAAALGACADDPNIDGVVLLLTPQVMTPVMKIAELMIEWKKKVPLMPLTASFIGFPNVQDAIAHLQKNGIPSFETPERAIHTMAALRKKEVIMVNEQSESSGLRATRAAELLKGIDGVLSEDTVRDLFNLYGLPLPKGKVAKTKEEAVMIAEEIGYPVVAKISSPQILHKTDVGGIKVNLKNADQVQESFDVMTFDVRTKAPDATINGIFIQQFLPVGEEFIVGALKDPNFGSLVMTGLGGIYTELFKDTSFRIAPVTEEMAYGMLQDLTSWKVLLGMRGKKQANIDALVRLITTVSEMAYECPMITELDVNPVLVGEKEVVIADVKIVIK